MSTESDEVQSCTACARVRSVDTDPTDAIAWCGERDRGRTRWLCPQCTRLNARNIESKLSAEYW